MPVPMVMPIACLRPARRAAPPFAEHRAVGVVVERRGQPEPLVDDRAAGSCASRGWASAARCRACVSSGPGAPTPDAEDLRVRRFAPRRRRWRSRPAHTRRSSTSFAPRLRVGRLAGDGEHARTVLGHAADHEVGPADVNAQNESHECLLHARHGRHRGGDLTRPIAPACSGDDPAGTSPARARSRDGRPATHARPPGPVRRGDRTRKPSPSARTAPRSACPRPSPGAAAPNRW